MGENNKAIETIISFLKTNPSGSTPSDIARKTKINRMTVSKYLNILKAVNIVSFKGVGMAKVYVLNDSPLFSAISDKNGNHTNIIKQAVDDMGIGINISDKNLDIVWYNKNLKDWIGKDTEEVKGKKCYTVFKNNKSICEGCPCVLTLKDGKVHSAINVGIDKQGKNRIFYLISSPLYDIHHKITGVIEVTILLDNCDKMSEQIKILKSKYNIE